MKINNNRFRFMIKISNLLFSLLYRVINKSNKFFPNLNQQM